MYLRDLIKLCDNGGAVDHPASSCYYQRLDNGWISYPRGTHPLLIADWILDDRWTIHTRPENACPVCEGKGWHPVPGMTCTACAGSGIKKPEPKPEPVIINRIKGDTSPVPEGARVREWWMEQHKYGPVLHCTDMTNGGLPWHVLEITPELKIGLFTKIGSNPTDRTIPTDEWGRIKLVE